MIHVTNMHQVEGVFREPGQARLALAAARRRGFDVPAPERLVQDVAGVHVVLGTTCAAEDARQLLLDYGAYRVSTIQP